MGRLTFITSVLILLALAAPDATAGKKDTEATWAFKAPFRRALPTVEQTGWSRNAIDRFVLARLEREGLSPSPEADRTTLIRRLSLDVIGLPPSIQDVDAFGDDRRPDAYERLAERLLASPHHGERQGRHWLDAARYADSDGFEKDKARRVWFYRDWVINALNRDLPYDRFIVEQIAGDLLPGATQDQVVATGFLRNSMINEEGGVDPEQFRMEAMFDRMDAIGKGILGLTIQCAQCHDHKYDPLSQAEYYQLFAFINNDHEANVAVYTPEESQHRSEIFRRIGEIEKELKHRNPDWRERMEAWEGRARDGQPEWTVIQPKILAVTASGQKYLPQADGSILCQGFSPIKSRSKLSVETDLENISAVRLELLNDPNLPLGGPGRSYKGTCALSEFEIEAAPRTSPEDAKPVPVATATSDVELPEGPLDPHFDDDIDRERFVGPASYAIDGKPETAWYIDAGAGRRNQPRKAVFSLAKPISHPGGSLLHFHFRQDHGGWNNNDDHSNNMGRFRLSITQATKVVADPLPKAVRDILSIAPKKRRPAQSAQVFSYFRTTVAEWKAANDQIEALWGTHPVGTAQLVLKKRSMPRMTHVLKRGDFLSPAEPVAAAVPTSLHALPQNAPASRVTLARWLSSPESPTTARSMVNRVWQSYFGVGLVSTSEDLGTRSEQPSHPALLDWLAVEFMESGWSLKALERLIVTSSTYRQSSRVSRELHSRDPDNRLLARGPRFRVDAELVRDIALSASGLLSRKIGGPSVYPPLPEYMLHPPVSFGHKVWYEATGEDRYRRALYTFRYRSVPYPSLEVFDAPNGDFSCVKRARSNTPLQALATLNEPVFADCARALALLALKEGGSADRSRLELAFRRCVSRPPSSEESTLLLELLAKEKRHIRESGGDPWEIAAIDPEARPALPTGATAVDLAAWTTVSRVLLNLDETITKE